MFANAWVLFLALSTTLSVPAAILGCMLLHSHKRFWREIHEASVRSENLESREG